jgi:hypothetical protein
LIIYNGHFFNSAKPAEFLVQITFLGADTQTKDTKYIGWVRRLLGHVSMQNTKGEKNNKQLAHVVAVSVVETYGEEVGCDILHCLLVEGCESASDHEMENFRDHWQVVRQHPGEALYMHQNKGRRAVLIRCTEIRDKPRSNGKHSIREHTMVV